MKYLSVKYLRNEEERYLNMLKEYNRTHNPQLMKRIGDLYYDLCKSWDRIRSESINSVIKQYMPS